MRIHSVNIAAPAQIEGHLATTGIFKRPHPGPVMVAEHGLDGDVVCNRRHHGGPDQAVYGYGSVDYAWWEAELEAPLAPGTFGENITIDDCASGDWNIGDRFRIDDVVLEITAPRIPCATLAARMGDADFPRRFREAQRPGLYFRVVQAGSIGAGACVEVERTDGPTVAIVDMYRWAFMRSPPKHALHSMLEAPIDIRSRRKIEAALARKPKKRGA